MNIQSLQRSLPVLMKHNIVPFIWGYQGIGKTESVGQVARRLYGPKGFIHLHLATQEVGDLVGLLMIQPDGTVKHARPEWFPTEGEGVIFLDELNRAHPDVIQAMFSFITSKTIHTHKLPDGWKIVAAGNYQCDSFNTTDTSDAAWISRFCHLELKPSVQEFTAYAESRGAVSVADFISEHPLMLEAAAKPQELFVTPDRRSWLGMIAPLEQEEMVDEDRFEIYSGIVGTAAAAAFFAHRNSATKGLRIADILRDYSAVRPRVRKLSALKDTRFDLLGAPIDELLVKLAASPSFLTAAGTANLKQYFLDIPLELLSKACKKLGVLSFDQKHALLNDPEFVAKLSIKE